MKRRFVTKCKAAIIWEVKTEEHVERATVRLATNTNIDNIPSVKPAFLQHNIKIRLVKWIYSRLAGSRTIPFI